MIGLEIFAIGVDEYLNLSGMKYDADIGIMGFESMISFKRSGFRNRQRAYRKTKIPLRHKVSKDEVISLLKTKFKTEVEK